MNDLTGRKYNRLTVLRFHNKTKSRNSKWVCLCDCGNESSVVGSQLIDGSIKSCGCLRVEKCSVTGSTNKQHGQANTKTYHVWESMKARCLNPNNNAFNNYGGRGIAICERWLNSYENFLADMDEAPEKMTLERKNNELGYYKENCIWASVKTQSNNRRTNHVINTANGPMTVTEAAEHFGLKPVTIFARIRNGWPQDRWLEPLK